MHYSKSFFRIPDYYNEFSSFFVESIIRFINEINLCLVTT